MYPRILIDLQKLKENIVSMKELASKNGIPFITMVVKAFAGDIQVLNAIKEAGVTCIGDSRIQNLKAFKALNFKHQMLLRSPMKTEIADVIQYADISLNSEYEIIELLNNEAKRQNKTHQIIIMFDLGDLREGIYYTSDYIETIQNIYKLENIVVLGIGTNLTCYGGLVPSKEIYDRLLSIKSKIEEKLDVTLDVISGGNSSSVTLFNQNIIPKEVNHLRLGEAILFGKETSYSTEIDGMHHDVFSFETEIIESKVKPSFPDGITSINSFGVKPNIIDKGLMKRAILAIGKQDVILDNLFPKDKNVTIIGGSSDHLIVDITNTSYKVGEVMKFNINYPALVHLMNSDYVEKTYK